MLRYHIICGNHFEAMPLKKRRDIIFYVYDNGPFYVKKKKKKKKKNNKNKNK